MIAKYIKENGLYKLKRLLFISSCVLLVGMLVLSCYCGNHFFLAAVWTVPSTLIVLALSNIVVPQSSTITKILVGFGNISFEFFLVHQLFLRYFSILFKKLDVPYLGAYILAFIFACIAAFLLHNKPLKKTSKG